MSKRESKRWPKLVTVLVVASGLVWLNASSILTEYALWFRVDNAVRGADAIVVLGPARIARVDKAFDLVEEGYSQRILITELPSLPWKYGVLRDDPTLWVELYGQERELFPKIDLVRSFEGGVLSTWDEAWDLRRYCEVHDLTHLIIVTNAFHTRRALYAFEKVFVGSETKVDVAAAQNGYWDETFWWKTEGGLQAYITEPAKFLFYLFTERNLPFLHND